MNFDTMTDPPVADVLKEYVAAVYFGHYATAEYLRPYLPEMDTGMVTSEDAFEVVGEIVDD